MIRILIVIVIAAFFLMLGYMLEKKIAKQIDKKKREMQEEEVRYSIEIIKNELSDLPIYKLDRNNQYAEK